MLNIDRLSLDLMTIRGHSINLAALRWRTLQPYEHQQHEFLRLHPTVHEGMLYGEYDKPRVGRLFDCGRCTLTFSDYLEVCIPRWARPTR